MFSMTLSIFKMALGLLWVFLLLYRVDSLVQSLSFDVIQVMNCCLCNGQMSLYCCNPDTIFSIDDSWELPQLAVSEKCPYPSGNVLLCFWYPCNEGLCQLLSSSQMNTFDIWLSLDRLCNLGWWLDWTKTGEIATEIRWHRLPWKHPCNPSRH